MKREEDEQRHRELLIEQSRLARQEYERTEAERATLLREQELALTLERERAEKARHDAERIAKERALEEAARLQAEKDRAELEANLAKLKLEEDQRWKEKEAAAAERVAKEQRDAAEAKEQQLRV